MDEDAEEPTSAPEDTTMMYTIERLRDGRWTRESEAVPISQNEFATQADAQDVIDELRQHPEWTMAQFQIQIVPFVKKPWVTPTLTRIK
jgi:hypothetical protein